MQAGGFGRQADAGGHVGRPEGRRVHGTHLVSPLCSKKQCLALGQLLLLRRSRPRSLSSISAQLRPRAVSATRGTLRGRGDSPSVQDTEVENLEEELYVYLGT